MGKKREKPERHKQNLADQLEDPETYGVRVGAPNTQRRLFSLVGQESALWAACTDMDLLAD